MPARITHTDQLRTLARLRRVNAALSAWDELAARSLMPRRGGKGPRIGRSLRVTPI